MRTAHAIAITTATLAFPLLLATGVSALEVPDPGSAPSTNGSGESSASLCSATKAEQRETTAPVPHGFMGRPGW